ncbi:hypothetical protein GCM10010339_56720 [Streptomyces alanosinicus]|uniref:Uncharacterized protein n=1 Tax=Streptomyces alanosinicus TaxID=68171 RepID=A0A918YM78_9ACTN|nr:hypothetical protein GCM10010339_56720 [Streptomyces alanosinicus]
MADQQQFGEIRIQLRRVTAPYDQMVTERRQRRAGERTEIHQAVPVQVFARGQDTAGRLMDDRRMQRVPWHDDAGSDHDSPVRRGRTIK